jgi:osmoprotectant transport system ATP-binding protein
MDSQEFQKEKIHNPQSEIHNRKNPQSEIRNPQSAVRLSRVSYQLPDGHRLVSDIDLELAAGETLVLVGRSGSGKTTILKLINALLTPTSGEIEVLGKRSREWDPIGLRRKIGYVIQEVGLFPHFTVEANVALVPRLEGWQEERIQARSREMLELVGLDPERFLRRYPSQLSGGQRQRVGVARALAADPPLMLLDEPFGALDPLTRSEIQVEFRSLKQRLKKTMIFVTHDVREALILGDRIGLVRDGVLARISAARDFLASDDPEVSAYRKSLEAL